MNNSDKYLLLAVRAALAAGNEIREVYDLPLCDVSTEIKGDGSPLTVADTRAHRRIMSMLVESPFPVLSEEGEDIPYEVRRRWDVLWIVDPLDGTKEFIKRNGEFTVNIALVEHGEPVMGVIYLPVKKELYFGANGQGAFILGNVETLRDDDSFLTLSSRSTRMPVALDRRGCVIVASRSHYNEETNGFIEKIKENHGGVDTVTVGSSVKICFVAEGKADLYPRFGPTMEWDTAAGDAIARAAGMQMVSAVDMTPLRYNKKELLNPSFIVGSSRFLDI